MSIAASTDRPAPGLRNTARAERALSAAAKSWFVAALLGQYAFVYYILVFYGGTVVHGRFEDWNRRSLITGYVAGDHVGNLQFLAHVLLAAAITTSGALQLIPQIRARARGFHRWNGRFYLATSLLAAVGGLWLVWGRGTYLTLLGAVGISTVALLIVWFGVQTLRYALQHKLALHRRFALRLFLVVNAVWFQRIGYMAWILLNQGPVGMTGRMDGPFDIAWGFGSFLLPLAVLEFYFLARGAGAAAKFGMASALAALTLVMAVGIGGATFLMWGPYL